MENIVDRVKEDVAKKQETAVIGASNGKKLLKILLGIGGLVTSSLMGIDAISGEASIIGEVIGSIAAIAAGAAIQGIRKK